MTTSKTAHRSGSRPNAKRRAWLLAAVAIASLAGCGTPPASAGASWILSSKARQVPARVVRLTPDTGAVKLTFEGLGAPRYNTLQVESGHAGPILVSHIARVVVKLSGRAIPRPLEQAVAGPGLFKPTVDVSFQRVPAGPAVMNVEAFGKAGEVIGRGTAAVRVVAGTNTRVAIEVQVDPPRPETGGVSALVSFRPRITLR